MQDWKIAVLCEYLCVISPHKWLSPAAGVSPLASLMKLWVPKNSYSFHLSFICFSVENSNENQFCMTYLHTAKHNVLFFMQYQLFQDVYPIWECSASFIIDFTYESVSEMLFQHSLLHNARYINKQSPQSMSKLFSIISKTCFWMSSNTQYRRKLNWCSRQTTSMLPSRCSCRPFVDESEDRGGGGRGGWGGRGLGDFHAATHCPWLNPPLQTPPVLFFLL